MNRSWLQTVALTALTLLTGLHLFRVFLPILVWYFGQFVNAYGLAVYAFITFSLSLFAPTIRQMLGGRGALALTVGGLALIRLALQFTNTPLYELALSTTGLVLWSWFLPLIQQSARNRPGIGQVPLTVVAFPLAFILDTVSRTLLFSYDLAWRQTLWAKIVVLGLVVVMLWLLWQELNRLRPMQPAEEPTMIRVWPLVGLGPFYYLILAVVQNPAALAANSGASDFVSHLAVNALAIIGGIVCVLAAANSRTSTLIAAGTGILLPITYFLRLEGLLPAAIAWPILALGLWAALGWTLNGTARRERTLPPEAVAETPTAPVQPPSQWRSTLAVYLGLLALLVIVFLAQQFNILQAGTFAALIVGISGWWAASRGERIAPAVNRPSMQLVAIAGALSIILVLPWIPAELNNQPAEKPASAETTSSLIPIKVMTYNIHQGLDAHMQPDLEAVAAVIAAENPGILALNEVNRARSSNGFIDTLFYLSRTLKMPYVFGANSPDLQYGNAILSVYPIMNWENIHYLINTTERRGILRAQYETWQFPITIFSTHLDHIASPNNARGEQVTQALAIMAGQENAVFLGDLNATPEKEEIGLIYSAGYIDVFQASGRSDVFTYWDEQPGRRIDYIFVTPDITIQDAWTVQSRASDHLPVITVIQNNP